MKIVLPGGTGQVGTVLARAFHGEGHEVVILSRRPERAPWRVAEWDAETQGRWAAEFEGADAVINLAGRSVNCRYSPANRRAIKESRVNSARAVGEAIAGATRPPRVWLQMSTATIYAHRFDAPNDEATGRLGGAEPDAPDTWRFSLDVATSWERVVDEIATPHTRKVKMRAAMIMSPDAGGVFDTLLRLVRFGLGGKAGDGRQYVSWIHDEDFVRAVRWLIEHGELAGAINLAAPNPVTNAEFMRALREAWGIRFGAPATELMLEAGAFLLRSETELILKSRRVVPSTLLESGFEFHFPAWPEAARDLCRRYRHDPRGAGESVQASVAR
ncbi:MAG TPA: TIGR01777 family oxidoreductase [Pyrinomonadaceae bacterium]